MRNTVLNRYLVRSIMNEQVLQDWLQERLERISKHAKTIQPGFYPEPIHHMRTETKRLRAMLRLMSFDEEEELKLPGSYRKLYRISGTVRDAQIHLQELFVSGLPRLPLFSIWLGRNMSPGIEKWENKFKDDALEPLEKFIAGLAAKKLQLQHLFDYFRKRKAEIATLMNKEPDDEELHQIRKYSKDLLYILAFCEKQWPEGREKLRPLEAVLKRVSDRAGAFNDKRNLLDSMNRFQEEYKDHLENEDREHCEKAIRLWTHKKEQARKRLLSALRALLRRRIPRSN